MDIPNPPARTGLARVISQPEQREYLVAQFLGEEPATVPRVLTDASRRPSEKFHT